jgi:formylglycine-generating enzyme required for sulfatase activity
VDAAAFSLELRGALDATARPRRARSPRRARTVALGALAVLLAATIAAAWMAGRSAEVPAPSTPAKASVVPPTGPRSTPEPTVALPDRPALPAGVERGERQGEYINMKDGSVLVYVPAGGFLMGHPDDPAPSSGDLRLEVKWNDRPAHRVQLSGYFIGKDEVTWAQWRRFAAERPAFALADGADRIRDVGGRPFHATDQHPVFGITWEQARAYCEWARLRLPTEAEWEYAARGPLPDHVYPWGPEDLRPGDANVLGDRDGAPGPSPVGTFPRDTSPFGCRDMCGNVAEWVWDYYGPYDDSPARDPRGPELSTQHWPGLEGWRPLPPGVGPLRVIRGGAWRTSDGSPPSMDPYAPDAYVCQVTRRFAAEVQTSSPILGLRVARTR